MNMVAGEVRDPERSIPRALGVGIAIVIAIYLGANLVYLHALGRDGLAASSAAAADAAARYFGPGGARFIAVSAMISIFGFVSVAILSNSRIVYAMAADGSFFRAVGRVHPRFGSPHIAIVLIAVWSIVLLLFTRGDLGKLLSGVVFADWIFFGLGAASVFVLRRRRPELARPYRVLGYPWLPAFFVVAAGVGVASSFIAEPAMSLLGVAQLGGGARALPLRSSGARCEARGVGRGSRSRPARASERPRPAPAAAAAAVPRGRDRGRRPRGRTLVSGRRRRAPGRRDRLARRRARGEAAARSRAASSSTTRTSEFVPRAQAAIRGGMLNVRNADDSAHRARFTLAGGRRRGLAAGRGGGERRGAGGARRRARSRRAGLVLVTCDLHPATRGWIRVFDQPYFTVPDSAGRFAFDSVPPGRWRLRAWSPVAGEIERDVIVDSAGTAFVELRLPP